MNLVLWLEGLIFGTDVEGVRAVRCGNVHRSQVSKRNFNVNFLRC